MRSQSAALAAVAGICALNLVSCGGDDSGERGQAATDTGHIFRNVDVRLDRRCQVAVFDMSLTRDAPLGLRLVGRVPFGRQRTIQLLRPRKAVRELVSVNLPLAARQQSSRPAKAGVHRTEVWDLVYPNGDYLKPGTHRGKLRAFDSTRERVIDTFSVTLTIPESFYAGSPDHCGEG